MSDGSEEITEEMSSSCSPDWANAARLTSEVLLDFALPGSPVEIPGTAKSV